MTLLTFDFRISMWAEAAGNHEMVTPDVIDKYEHQNITHTSI